MNTDGGNDQIVCGKILLIKLIILNRICNVGKGRDPVFNAHGQYMGADIGMTADKQSFQRRFFGFPHH
jgi:hypothetical protein